MRRKNMNNGMGMVSRGLIAAVVVLSTVFLSDQATAGTVTIGFEVGSDSTPLANGLDMDAANPYSDLFIITSSGNNLGAALYDSGPNTPNTRDRDLHVDLGNVLILQNRNSDDRVAGGTIFETPNDSPRGGYINFDFSPLNQGVSMISLDVIDVDNDGQMRITLTDSNNNTRVVNVPDHFTGDIRQGDVGLATINLASGIAQESPNVSGLFTSIVTDAGFDINDVVNMQVKLFGSGAIDNLTFTIIPLPAGALLGMAGLGLVIARRRRFAKAA